MSTKVDEYLLKKFSIPQIGLYSQPGSELCDILHRLNKNKKLDDTDKKWIRDKGMSNLYKFLEDWETTGKPDFYALHKSLGFPYKSYVSPPTVSDYESRQIKDKYLLEKYALVRMGNNYELRHELCNILRRLDDGKLNDADKEWIKDQKEMSEFYKFIKNWEDKGKPDFDTLYNPVLHVTKTKNKNKSKRNSTFEKRKEFSPIDVSTNMRKPHMALIYKKAKLIEHIKSNLEKITPSNIPEDSSSLFLPKIWDTINESIKKDINELFRVYSYSLWTSTSLMAYRIFENVLKVHIEHDLKDKPAVDITDAIKKLEMHSYDPNLLKILYELKENRNSFMHGNTRASTQEAKESIVKVISLAMNIHNIKP